ncbi:MAG: RNA-binding cell elongation regulator Jag/EloR [Bacillota bacterium]|jgi:spoIIIJ-associated protein|nr:protein jag [Bacillota bacterium]MDI9415528.1 RNA-binding cell elongation regulator Jag/EloR [Bacillota bacterium]NLD11918.1 protein jag [Bacillota bacterium]HCD41988.1 protein jag [Bacillota bacterium]HOB89257.1 RNA-binding cell elongation regulator Jag/EloR [Bacillota bacterium]
MVRSVEKSGKTVEEAVQDALKDLGLSQDEVDIEILEEPSRGILGLVGQRLARVKVTEKMSLKDEVYKFFERLIDYMDLGDITIESSFDDGTLEFKVFGDEVGVLIGRRGATLDAVQYLVNLVAGNCSRRREASGEPAEEIRILVDAGGYRSRRVASLRRLAKSVAARVRRDGGAIRLEPMNPMERRIVHLAVQECSGVESFSEGEDPYRYVVVAPKEA